MDTLSIVSWVVNGLMGVVMYLLRNAYNDLKAEVKENKHEIQRVKEASMKKEDFLDFKQELWNRLDRFEDAVNAKLFQGRIT